MGVGGGSPDSVPPPADRGVALEGNPICHLRVKELSRQLIVLALI